MRQLLQLAHALSGLQPHTGHAMISRAAIAQLARDFGEESVVANHHADPPGRVSKKG